jgi:hypothetical protein
MGKLKKTIAMIFVVAGYNCLFFMILEWKSEKTLVPKNTVNCTLNITCLRLCKNSSRFYSGQVVNASEINPSWNFNATFQMVSENQLEEGYYEEEDAWFVLTKVRIFLHRLNVTNILTI